MLSVTVSTAGLSLHPSAISYSICAAGTGPLLERITRQLQAGTTANASFMSLHLRVPQKRNSVDMKFVLLSKSQAKLKSEVGMKS